MFIEMQTVFCKYRILLTTGLFYYHTYYQASLFLNKLILQTSVSRAFVCNLAEGKKEISWVACDEATMPGILQLSLTLDGPWRKCGV